MNRALLRLSIGCLALFVLLLINVNYVQAFEASSMTNDPGNSRTFDQQFQYQRGSIVADGDGTNVKIAESRQVKGGSGYYKRYYPDGPVYAPVTGYDSIYSATGIEQAENKWLSGTDPKLAVHNFISLITGNRKQGATVALTISPKAQVAAYDALKAQGSQGAAVAIDPSTGAILAMASYPSFNPDELATLSGTQLQKNDTRLLKDPSQPLLNRAINATYPPGSSFKLITSSAALTTGKVASPQALVNGVQFLSLPGTTHKLNNNDDELCGDGHPPMIEAFAISCDTTFGYLGEKLGGSTLRKYAEKFGVNDPHLTVPLDVTPSSFPPVSNPDYTAYSAIGQYDDEFTPLQEAMDAATIANHGTLMRPYLVQQVLASDESPVQTATPQVLSHAISPRVASDVKKMMIAVTHETYGTGYETAGPPATSIDIAGKTGTAQTGINNTGLNDAVFTAFAPASDPKIAVGVMIKGGGYGAAAAAPIAVKIIEAYLGRS